MRRWPNTNRVEAAFDFGGATLPVGTAVGEGRRIQFQYDRGLKARGIAPSPIRAPLVDEPFAGPTAFDGLPGLLFDSLPDGWSRLVLDRHLLAQGWDPSTLGPLDRLALVGGDGVGALVYSGPLIPTQAPSFDFDTVAALVGGAPQEEDADRVRAALTLSRSLGGARPKANAYLSAGAFGTAETPGAEPWIVKFHAKEDGPQAGAVEYAYSLMARAAGITMPDTHLLPSKHTAGYFAVRRFDRPAPGRRLHVHSLGGLLQVGAGSTAGYKELMQVTGALTYARGADAASIAQQIRRMAFNVHARNRDDHVRNHSFLMDENGAWDLAPAFDLTFSNLPRHALMIADDRQEVTREDMLAVTRNFAAVSDAQASSIIDEVREVVRDWATFARRAGVDATTTRGIEDVLASGSDGPDWVSMALQKGPGGFGR